MSDSKNIAVLGNFKDPNKIMHAANKVRESGYTDFDIYTPYPIHGLDKAMGVKRSILPYISFAGAMFGLSNAVFLMWWTGAVDYKLNIGGKPFFSVQFGIPIMFELTVLLTGLATFVALWALCGLPKWYSDLQDDAGFQSAVDDTFVLSIFATDQRFSLETTTKFMNEIGADDVRLIEA
jgi:hypothetical protein